MGNNIVEIKDSNFDGEVIKSDLPVLVDFWAPWCGPCRTIAPSISELAAEYTGKLKVCKVNIDENPVTPTKFGIRSIPTVMVFKNGAILEQVVGAKPKEEIKEIIERHV